MTDKYNAYLIVLQQRDAAMQSLAILALGIILAWYIVRRATTMQAIFAAGGIVLWLLTIIIFAMMELG